MALRENLKSASLVHRHYWPHVIYFLVRQKIIIFEEKKNYFFFLQKLLFFATSIQVFTMSAAPFEPIFKVFVYVPRVRDL